jgi:hypothetical protein
VRRERENWGTIRDLGFVTFTDEQRRRGGGRRDELVFWIFRAWLPGSGWTTEWGSKVASAVSGEPDGVRAGEAVRVQSAEEGASVDLLECSESREEVLRLRGCHG